MKFQVLLAFVVVIAYCQAQPKLRDSDSSPAKKGQMARQQGRLCNCIEGKSGPKLKCPCVPPPPHISLSKEQNALCKKIPRKRRCQQGFNRGNGKETKGKKVISTPI